MAHAVRGLKLSSGFCKAAYLDHYSLTYFYTTYSNFPDLNIAFNADDNNSDPTDINFNKVLHDLERVKYFIQMVYQKSSEGKRGKVSSSYELNTRN